MRTIRECCDTFRTRNAGAFLLTFDVVFSNEALYHLWRDSGLLTAETVAERYGVDPTDVSVIDYPPANALKITFPRRHVAGGPSDTDLDSAAQFVPLLDLALDVPDALLDPPQDGS